MVSDSVTIALISAVSAAIGAFLTKIPAIMNMASSNRVSQLDALQRDYSSVLSDLRADLTSVKSEVADLRKNHASCQVENAHLNGEVNLLKYQMAVLVAGSAKVPLTNLDDPAKVDSQVHILPG